MVFIRKIKKGKYTYLARVENKWVDGKVVQKHLGYIGKEVSGKQIRTGTLENTEITKVTSWAPLLVLDRIAKRINLAEELGDYGEYLLSMVYAHCLDPKSVNQMQDWYERTDLHSMLSIENVSEQKLYNALDSIDERNYALVQKRIFRAVREKYRLKPKGICYDVTNVYFYGTECEIAKKGHNKEGTYRPQVQIGLAVTKDEGIPIFHKTYEGSIFDARTLQEFLIIFQELGIENMTIIWDRGVTSADNVNHAISAGLDVICGVAVRGNIRVKVDELLAKGEIQHPNNRVRLKKTVMYCTKTPYKYGDAKGILLLCYNEERARISKEHRLDKILEAQALAQEHKPLPDGMRAYVRADGTLNEETIAAAQAHDGYSVIFSTKDLPIADIVRPYFEEKDKVEKSFRSLKSVLGLKPIKHWLAERVKAHVLLCYISYLLLCLLEHKLKRIGISAITAIDKLSTAYKVHLKNQKTGTEFTKTVTLTKDQQRIMKAVDKTLVNEPSV